MPRVRWKRAHVCVCVFYVSSARSLWSCSCAYLHAWLVRARGRCEGFPSAWNEVVYSQWATTRDKIKAMDLKTWNREGWPKQPHGQCDALSVVFPQDAEQQQHQQHPRLQLQPHAQTPDFVRYYLKTILNAELFKINKSKIGLFTFRKSRGKKSYI